MIFHVPFWSCFRYSNGSEDLIEGQSYVHGASVSSSPLVDSRTVLNEIAREKISLVRRNEPTATTSTGMHQSWAEISSRTSNPGRFLCPVDNFLGEYLKCTGSERRSPFRLNSCKIYHEGSASRERNLVALRQEFFHIPLQIIHELPLLASE